jgi:hypothetical protein
MVLLIRDSDGSYTRGTKVVQHPRKDVSKNSDSLVTEAHYLRQMVPGFIKRGVSEGEARSANNFAIGTRVVHNANRESCAFTLLGRIDDMKVSNTGSFRRRNTDIISSLLPNHPHLLYQVYLHRRTLEECRSALQKPNRPTGRCLTGGFWFVL